MSFKIYVPLHVSGIWIPVVADSLRESGSLGSGVNLNLHAELLGYSVDSCSIELNEESVLVDHSKYICRSSSVNLSVKVRAPVDLGAGYGLSAASALIHALASGLLKGDERSLLDYAALAHEVEVLYSTGLGDVISEYYGGVEIRLRPGAPGYGAIKQIEFSGNPRLVACVLSNGETTPLMLKRVSREVYEYGRELLRDLTDNPTLENFFEKSQLFTRRVFEYERVDSALSGWKSKVNGFYRKKRALVVWCDESWASDLLQHLVENYKLKCYETSINTGGVRVVRSN